MCIYLLNWSPEFSRHSCPRKNKEENKIWNKDINGKNAIEKEKKTFEKFHSDPSQNKIVSIHFL